MQHDASRSARGSDNPAGAPTHDRVRPPWSFPAALLPGLLLTGLLLGAAGTQSASDERPAGRTVVELEVTGR